MTVEFWFTNFQEIICRKKTITFFNTMLFFVVLITVAVVADPTANRALWTWIGDDVPKPRRNDGPYYASACGNGGNGPPYAFSCPHHAMLSDDMISATMFDNLTDYRYAVAGSASDSLCGSCFQVQVLDAERVWKKDFPLLIVQVVNSGFDVMQGQLDLHVGAGGMGYFTALNRDCTSRHCAGGACKENMYDGSFDDWTFSPYTNSNPCYGGGLRLLNETSEDDVVQRCKALSGNSRDYKDAVLEDTCVRGNVELFHQNFVSSRYVRVQCPPGLYVLTGLRRDDDFYFPSPHPGLDFTNECIGSRSNGHFCYHVDG